MADDKRWNGEVAERSNAADCKSVALAASEVRILPSPPTRLRITDCGYRIDGDFGFGGITRIADGEHRVGAKRRSISHLRSEIRNQVGGSNSVVESQPSKLLVAGSIPVSRSIRLRAMGVPARFGEMPRRSAEGAEAGSFRPAEARPDRVRAKADFGDRPASKAADQEPVSRCSSVGRARPW